MLRLWEPPGLEFEPLPLSREGEAGLSCGACEAIQKGRCRVDGHPSSASPTGAHVGGRTELLNPVLHAAPVRSRPQSFVWNVTAFGPAQ